MAAASSNLTPFISGRINMPDTPERETTPRSFESALAEFEALVEKMERGDLSLEDSVSAYERGVVLHRYCEEALSTAERKIRILTEGPGDGDGGSEEGLRRFETESGDPRAVNEGGSAGGASGAAHRRPAAGETQGEGLLP